MTSSVLGRVILPARGDARPSLRLRGVALRGAWVVTEPSRAEVRDPAPQGVEGRNDGCRQAGLLFSLGAESLRVVESVNGH